MTKGAKTGLIIGGGVVVLGGIIAYEIISHKKAQAANPNNPNYQPPAGGGGGGSGSNFQTSGGGTQEEIQAIITAICNNSEWSTYRQSIKSMGHDTVGQVNTDILFKAWTYFNNNPIYKGGWQRFNFSGTEQLVAGTQPVTTSGTGNSSTSGGGGTSPFWSTVETIAPLLLTLI